MIKNKLMHSYRHDLERMHFQYCDKDPDPDCDTALFGQMMDDNVHCTMIEALRIYLEDTNNKEKQFVNTTRHPGHSRKWVDKHTVDL